MLLESHKLSCVRVFSAAHLNYKLVITWQITNTPLAVLLKSFNILEKTLSLSVTSNTQVDNELLTVQAKQWLKSHLPGIFMLHNYMWLTNNNKKKHQCAICRFSLLNLLIPFCCVSVTFAETWIIKGRRTNQLWRKCGISVSYFDTNKNLVMKKLQL